MDKEQNVVGVAWYSSEQWDLLRSVSDDVDELEETYDDWIACAEKTTAQLEEQSIKIHKVHVDVDEIVEWCKENNKPVDAHARSEFTTHKLREMFGEK
ncbi:MAG: hypothetical protein ACYTF1_12795 [Planctomycetota bacterium]